VNPDMEKEVFIKEISKIKGIGKAKAELLFDKGYDTVEKVLKAKDADLLKLQGFNDKLVKDLQASLKKPTAKPKPVKTETKKEKPAKTPVKSKEAKKPETKPKKPEKKVEKEKTEKPKKGKEEEPEKAKEEVKEEIEEEGYKAKKKPELSKELKQKLRIRKEIQNRRPEFLREEWFRYKRVPKNWRRPDGLTSKMRINLKYRPSKVRVGFRGPRDTRGLHSSGFEEVMVYNPGDIEKVNPKTQAARIGASVGTKKRMDIEKKAEKMDVRILNL